LPKGKVIALVDHTDVARAKEVLGGHTCIIGTGPASLRYASVLEVEDYFKNQIQVCGKGGGYMLNLSFPHNATIDQLKAMVKSIKEYGTY
jgi:uroporphyrinogen-III decarboxylase